MFLPLNNALNWFHQIFIFLFSWLDTFPARIVSDITLAIALGVVLYHLISNGVLYLTLAFSLRKQVYLRLADFNHADEQKKKEIFKIYDYNYRSWIWPIAYLFFFVSLCLAIIDELGILLTCFSMILGVSFYIINYYLCSSFTFSDIKMLPRSSLYNLAVINFTLLSSAIIPMTIYLGSDFVDTVYPITFFDLFNECFIAVLSIFLFFLLFRCMMPKATMLWLDILSLSLLFIFTINLLLFHNYYGPVHGLAFGEIKTFSVEISDICLDFTIVFLSCCLTLFCIKHIAITRKALLYCCFTLLLLAILFKAENIYIMHFDALSFDRQETYSIESPSSSFVPPTYHQSLWRLSKTEPNILGLFFDGFTGSHMANILSADAKLGNRLDGFVYYNDCVSASHLTFLTLPSLYGGNKFTIRNLHSTSPDISIQEKMTLGIAALPNAFADTSFDIVLTGLEYIEKPLLSASLKNPDQVLCLYDKDFWRSDYVSYWLKWAKVQGIVVNYPSQITDSIATYLISLAWLQGAPIWMKPTLHNCFEYTDISKNMFNFNVWTHFLPAIATIQHMPDFLHTTDGPGTVKVFHNSLSHFPFYLNDDSLQPVFRPVYNVHKHWTNNTHLTTEKWMIKFLKDIVDSLKSMGIYNNTRIVVFSDHDLQDGHGIKYHDKMFKNRVPAPDALLLFKDFKASGPLVYSGLPMSTVDVPSLLIKDVVSSSIIPEFQEPMYDRLRPHDLVNDVENDIPLILSLGEIRHSKYKIADFWNVKANMRNRKHWINVTKEFDHASR